MMLLIKEFKLIPLKPAISNNLVYAFSSILAERFIDLLFLTNLLFNEHHNSNKLLFYFLKKFIAEKQTFDIPVYNFVHCFETSNN